jgi:ferritin-like metal-binding protein YciE
MATSYQDTYVTGLRNAHALEHQAIQLLERQVERLQNYPALVERMRAHIEESRRQSERLERILSQHGASHSALKDIGTSIMGNLAAMAHAPAQDEVVKNSFANFAFEHYEIASYRALIEMANMAGDGAGATVLRESLDEEVAMARWLDEHLEETIRTYTQREAAGEKAGV